METQKLQRIRRGVRSGADVLVEVEVLTNRHDRTAHVAALVNQASSGAGRARAALDRDARESRGAAASEGMSILRVNGRLEVVGAKHADVQGARRKCPTLGVRQPGDARKQ